MRFESRSHIDCAGRLTSICHLLYRKGVAASL